jgi:hypothetical protein
MRHPRCAGLRSRRLVCARHHRVYARRRVRRPLRHVYEHGGEVRQATQLDSAREETDHGPPQILPDGKHFLFQVLSGRPENTGMFIASLDGKGRTHVLTTNLNALFAPPGYLVFVRGIMIPKLSQR